MELKFKRQEMKYETMLLEIPEQDYITLTELYIATMPDTCQEVFYAELKNKEITLDNVKSALFNAIITKVSTSLLQSAIAEYKVDPEKLMAELKTELNKENSPDV